MVDIFIRISHSTFIIDKSVISDIKMYSPTENLISLYFESDFYIYNSFIANLTEISFIKTIDTNFYSENVTITNI